MDLAVAFKQSVSQIEGIQFIHFNW